MSHEKVVVRVQRGVWIDEQRLVEARLRGEVEITVRPGEIRIGSAESRQGDDEGAAKEPLLEVAGILAGSPLSAEEVERLLYERKEV